MTRRIFCKVLLVVVAIFGLLVLSGVLSAQGNRDWAFERVREVQERNTDALMARPGVVGTAVGFNNDGEYAVLVLLEIPGVASIPQELDGVPVQVVVTGKILALSHTKDRLDRPVPTGVSTGHPDITAGTIACRVTDGTNVYALSNNHVYANSNKASLGDAVIQPGTFDGGSSPADDIGTLFDFEEIRFAKGRRVPKNTIDAAIALSSTAKLGNATPDDGYGTPNSTIVGAFIDQQVQKFGRTTGLTKGQVYAINATVDVNYGGGKVARFVGQIIITPGSFSAGGDSGSLIVTDDDNVNPVGLLFAGSSSMTVANPIDLVLTRFDVTVDDTVDDGEGPPPNDSPTVFITSPANGSTFDSGETIAFVGTASDTEDEDLTASLVWTSDIVGQIGTGGNFSVVLSDGTHTITASVTDDGSKTGSDSISITVGTLPEEATTVSVTSITYATEGGRKQDKHLLITVTLEDDLGNPVAGASASTKLDNTTTGQSWTGAGTTGTNGTVTFTLKNARAGMYTTAVTGVTVEGLDWDGLTPNNSFTK